MGDDATRFDVVDALGHQVDVLLHAPFGLVKTSVDKGISGGGDEPAPFICMGHVYFEDLEGFEKGMAEAGHLLRGDVLNFTNITPTRQISEILD